MTKVFVKIKDVLVVVLELCDGRRMGGTNLLELLVSKIYNPFFLCGLCHQHRSL